nr:hypothetical protein [Sedimentibacter sp.]
MKIVGFAFACALILIGINAYINTTIISILLPNIVGIAEIVGMGVNSGQLSVIDFSFINMISFILLLAGIILLLIIFLKSKK